uniref:Uncharacterized protein n=1 Tax=Odontella aurita TaxID=265563 RepID=A0A7S4MX45_9STRA
MNRQNSRRSLDAERKREMISPYPTVPFLQYVRTAIAAAPSRVESPGQPTKWCLIRHRTERIIRNRPEKANDRRRRKKESRLPSRSASALPPPASPDPFLEPSAPRCAQRKGTHGRHSK